MENGPKESHSTARSAGTFITVSLKLDGGGIPGGWSGVGVRNITGCSSGRGGEELPSAQSPAGSWPFAPEGRERENLAASADHGKQEAGDGSRR